MKLDDIGFKAGLALREASRGLTGTEINEVKSSRVPVGIIAGIGVFVATLVIFGGPNLWRDGSNGTTDSSSPAAALTPTRTDQDFRLLDGGSVRITADIALRLQSYTAFSEFAELGGERLVTVAAVSDPAELARIESAEEEEQLSESATVWRANRLGSPLFLSVDLGSWTVWLNVSTATEPLERGNLLSIVDQLTGTANDLGVVVPGLRFDYQELNMVGPDGGVVTLRIGACFREPVPGGDMIEHIRRGPMIRGDQYASWCTADGGAEVTVDGSGEFVEIIVETLTLTFE
ncbi:hypothetical protein BMS3Bbin02_00395 [bacterium BMS3Bbin02]|nr:hypothetical protein BMS3Bbin02_00395 [bacterium BMS3Bbin02]